MLLDVWDVYFNGELTAVAVFGYDSAAVSGGVATTEETVVVGHWWFSVFTDFDFLGLVVG